MNAPLASKPAGGRLQILSVSGGPYDQGYQHGRALKELIARGAVPYMARFLDVVVRGSHVPWVGTPLLRTLDWGLRKALLKRVPSYYLEMVRGLAEEADRGA